MEGQTQHLHLLQEQMGLLLQKQQPLGALRVTLPRAWLLSSLQRHKQLPQTPYSLLYRFFPAL